MPIPVSIEQMDGQWIAYADGLFGCYASNPTRDEAIACLPGALRVYLDWCANHCMPVQAPDPGEPVEIHEIIAEWTHPQSGEAINAFFAEDVAPITAEELEFIDCLLEWTRTDLLESFSGLSREALDRKVDGEWSIGGILFHTARAEWRYLDTLGLAPAWPEHPDENPVALLNWTHAMLVGALLELVGNTAVVWKDSELWSARKMLRRAIWHRRDHTGHVWEFRNRLKI